MGAAAIARSTAVGRSKGTDFEASGRWQLSSMNCGNCANSACKNFWIGWRYEQDLTKYGGVTTSIIFATKMRWTKHRRISSSLGSTLRSDEWAPQVNRMTSRLKVSRRHSVADAVSLTQTEGALDEVSSILHRMRELLCNSSSVTLAKSATIKTRLPLQLGWHV